MGGGVWQDNFDGTYTQLHDGYFVPATGYSYLDLYLMGMISAAEVPDFFILNNLVPAGKDANGRPMFKAARTKVTIQDVIEPRTPRPNQRHSRAVDRALGDDHRTSRVHDGESALSVQGTRNPARFRRY